MKKLMLLVAMAMVMVFLGCVGSPVKVGKGTPPTILSVLVPHIMVAGFREEISFTFSDPDGDVNYIELGLPSGRVEKIFPRGFPAHRQTEGTATFVFGGMYAHALSAIRRQMWIVAVDFEGNRSNKVWFSFWV